MIIAYAYVVADLIHLGHISHLKNVKALCDKLIVGVLTDQATQEVKPKPIMNFEERVSIIRELECVDCVVAQETYLPVKNAIDLGVDILAESQNHPHVTPKYLEELEKAGIRVVIFPYLPGHSSSKLKDKIVRIWKTIKRGETDA